MFAMQVANVSELLREVQMLKVTREVQAVISAATPGGAAAGSAAYQPASQQLQSLENLMKHNDRYSLTSGGAIRAWWCYKSLSELGGQHEGKKS